MDYLKKSRIEEVLIAILGKGTVTSRLLSRIEKILDAIRTDGSYNGPIMSEVEEILVCILTGEPFEKPTHSRIAAMLKVKANGGEYTELRKSRVEDLIFEWINAVESATYTGTLPATLRTVEGYLESYKIYGNTIQAGTPTPENPIMPSGCGVRTENLVFDGWAEDFVTRAATDNAYITQVDGRTCLHVFCNVGYKEYDTKYMFKTDFKESTVYTLSFVYMRPSSFTISSTIQVRYTDGTMNQLTSYINDGNWHKLTYVTSSEKTIKDICVYYSSGWVYIDVNTFMVVEGSTALPYEPYGYKLPLTVNGVEHPIYLNEPLCGIDTYTDSLELSTGILTRKIKRLVLTGTDADGTWKASSIRTGSVYLNVGTNGIINESICDRATNVKLLDDYHYGNIYVEKSGVNIMVNLWLFDTAITVEDFKAYLASEYAAGTPVTVWYVLAEPEVSTIPVPSGLTGTIDGYLIQDGTPAPETPIYPTANGVKQADGTYIIPYGYSVEYPIYIGDTQLAKDEYVDSTTGKIYRRTKNLSPPEEEWIDEWVWGDGTVHPSTEVKTSPFIDVSTCETCIMEVFSAETEWAEAGYRAMAFYDANKQYLGWIGGGGRRALTPRATENLSEFPVGTVYVRIGCSHGDQPFYPQLVSGYTPTHQFYPYLVPTDPPAPFPQIPTVAGTTVIDYNGEPKPDKVELTYSKPK